MRALITGITGQDGSYLAEYLLAKGYEVHGIVRRLSAPNHSNIASFRYKLVLHDADLHDQSSLDEAVRASRPSEVYNLAAQSFVGTSWRQPIVTAEVTALGAMRMLEAVRRFADGARFYQAGSSEMFGNAPAPQRETTPMHPRSPYGVAKLAAHHFARTYRESYGMFVSNGILFNHESERRGPEFVTRKISMWVASAAAGRPTEMRLGNVNAMRDWGYAPDYVDLMWRSLQHDRPGDYVGATGETHTVWEFLEAAATETGIRLTDQSFAYDDLRETRPAEVDELRGDASRAKKVLGWEPTVRFPELVRRMVRSDLERVQRNVTPRGVP